MAVAVADQNLLFGILALQMDFISQDALVAGMAGWMFKKDQSLGAILVAQGALDEEHHELLAALVQAHLKRHGNDPEKSLAALNGLGSIRGELEKIADPGLHASLRHVPHSEDADSVATAAPHCGTITSAGQRFRILRPHAKGGLGQIYVALDAELNREVALKEIQEDHADKPESRARFLLEAQVTGALEHPGIVPVYGLGQYAAGRPFYAMRFIRGDSLKDAIARFHRADAPERNHGQRDHGQRVLELHNLLRRFIDVCQALQYAHDRGILHRDLKPGNVMLGKYGETLLVDWGLAKAVGKLESAVTSQEPTLRPRAASSSAETVPGSTLGTPQYMSPEQAAGRLDQLGPASDVYSLGATLYCLLTGKPPFDDDDVGTLIQRVQRGDYLPPRRVNADVAPVLEAICQKAMALRPEDRYAAPRLLAEDVEAWLADEPVSVRPDPRLQRLIRWSRRHRILAEAAALTVVAAAVTATLLSLWLRQQTHQERAARKVAEQLREKGLRTAAQFAARTIAYEIDLRWWILKGAADDAELRKQVRSLAAVDQPHAQPAWKSLQAWTQERFTESARTKATSWFVVDHRGRHLARHPADEKLVGRSFAFRDYFHGLGRDFPEGVEKAPIQDVHRSIVFESQATGNRMVTFSVPIWDGAARASACLGVLGMSVELGEFAGLRLGAQDDGDGAERRDRLAVLVDLEEDWLEGRAQKGLILQHPWLEELRKSRAAHVPILRLDPDLVERLETLRQVRLRDGAGGAVGGTGATNGEGFDTNYRDPAGGAYAGRWLAAFEPILIEGRSGKIRDTGWAVVVQER